MFYYFVVLFRAGRHPNTDRSIRRRVPVLGYVRTYPRNSWCALLRRMKPRTSSLLLVVATSRVVLANDNGLALTPPMGWRSWNLYGHNVNQSLLETIMDGMVVKHNGVSLRDLGFADVGLDDNWQACGSPSAAPGMHYHDVDGNPLVNLERFPSLRNMTDHAHSLNLTAGWYGTCTTHVYLLLVALWELHCCRRRWLSHCEEHPLWPHVLFVVVFRRKQLHLQ